MDAGRGTAEAGDGKGTGEGDGGAPRPRTYGPRERMVFSAAQLIRRDGVNATGMREVAVHAGAPRGSLQHYFPGGKQQLVDEAVAWSGRYAARRIGRFLAALPEPSPSALFAAMVGQWIREYETEGFGAGCPVAAATVDCAQSAESTRRSAAGAFATWNAPLADALTGFGVPAAQAPALALLMISTLEGALLIARAEGSTAPLETVARELGPLLDGCATGRDRT
ncbi:transcriptional regulator, TetR family [Actinacidiphila yanglinensis]|uniref:Transcriptional regulator, TetR family n=2 Tax=Actinacidiphila yanglinensis TaxID=310779 RepID=A0A1H6EBA9_9ACTN|nr:transcriptional regulator, TetR family [Actinacidiphila yanglinensis]